VAKADLLLQLVEAALRSDDRRLRRTVEALIVEERAKRHTVLATELSELLLRSPERHATQGGFQRVSDMRSSDIVEVYPKRRLSELQLPEVAQEDIRLLIEEQHRADLLRAYNLEPRHKVLLIGPPGNGKTSCAEAIAAELAVPLIPLQYETLITSYLGETSAKLARVLGAARQRHCVLFLDEFDTVAKERGDEHDSGEARRIVSTLLLQLDQLPSHVIVCAATNHSELLDRAVWRRFELLIELPMPTRSRRVEFVAHLCERLALQLSISPRTIVDKLGKASYSDLEQFFLELRRRQILAGDFNGSDRDTLNRLLKAWAERSTTDRVASGD
jgi:AAA+ superfamily predicted ATPase